MSADRSGRSDALWLFRRERSRRGEDTIDGSLTQGSPSTRVVSSSDTAGTSASISIDTHALQLPLYYSLASQPYFSTCACALGHMRTRKIRLAFPPFFIFLCTCIHAYLYTCVYYCLCKPSSVCSMLQNELRLLKHFCDIYPSLLGTPF